MKKIEKMANLKMFLENQPLLASNCPAIILLQKLANQSRGRAIESQLEQ